MEFTTVEIELITSELTAITEYDLKKSYAEMLDECHDLVKIGNLEYLPSKVLSSVDPIAYNIGFSDYVSNELEELLYEIGNVYYRQGKVDALIDKI